jgi:hypothetical protein
MRATTEAEHEPRQSNFDFGSTKTGKAYMELLDTVFPDYNLGTLAHDSSLSGWKIDMTPLLGDDKLIRHIAPDKIVFSVLPDTRVNLKAANAFFQLVRWQRQYPADPDSIIVLAIHMLGDIGHLHYRSKFLLAPVPKHMLAMDMKTIVAAYKRVETERTEAADYQRRLYIDLSLAKTGQTPLRWEMDHADEKQAPPQVVPPEIYD